MNFLGGFFPLLDPWSTGVLGRVTKLPISHIFTGHVKEKMSENESEFGRVLRGYNPEEVDRLIQKLRRELVVAKTSHDDLIVANSELSERNAALEADIEQVGRPTFAGLGTKLESTLRTAEEQAARLIARAEVDATNITLNSQREADARIAAADEGLAMARAEAERMLEQAQFSAGQAAEEIITQATSAAERLVAEAEEEAAALRGQTATENANTRAVARHEISKLKAVAEREAKELRLITINKRPENVDVSQKVIKALKLDVENAARVDEMETEILARHQDAIAKTDKALDAAAKQLVTAKNRKRKAEESTAALLEQTQATVDARLAELETHIKAITAKATKESKDALTKAKKEAAQIVSEANEHISDLRVEQEAIGQYFEGLRLLLAQARDVQSQNSQSK